MRKLLQSSPAKVLTVVLLAQAALLYSAMRPEAIPAAQRLDSMPRLLGAYQFAFDGVIEQEVLDLLQADDVMDRWYVSNQGVQTNLYIAAFRSQRNGKAPHSPKNCLPGSGWAPVVEDYLSVDVGPDHPPITVNRYIVAHGEQRSLVLYWYQSRDRSVANEYRAKFWVIADAIRYNRTDTAIVRVMVPIRDTNDAAAERTGVDFVKTFFPSIRAILPS